MERGEVGEGREAGEDMSYVVRVDRQIDLVQRRWECRTPEEVGDAVARLITRAITIGPKFSSL